MIKLYGVTVSRAMRCLWALEECGVDYEQIPTHFIDESKAPEYLEVNPNGRIPALVDGELTLFESMAINLYLAGKYGADINPKSVEDQARTLQWSFWGMTELEPHLITMIANKLFLPEPERDAAAIAAAEESMQRPLAVIDDELSKRAYLLGEDFSIADLNVASVLSMANFVEFTFPSHSNVQRWFEACLSRPAFTRASNR